MPEISSWIYNVALFSAASDVWKQVGLIIEPPPVQVRIGIITVALLM